MKYRYKKKLTTIEIHKIDPSLVLRHRNINPAIPIIATIKSIMNPTVFKLTSIIFF